MSPPRVPATFVGTLLQKVSNVTTVTSREFNHDVGAAKRAAAHGPVVITDRGTPAFVLLTIEDYRRLSGERRSIVELLRADDDIEFEPPKAEITSRVPEL